MPSGQYDLLITATETNSHHGVGILLQRFFKDSTSFVCVRSTSLYNGEEPFGTAHHELCSRFLTLGETEDHLRQILALYKVRRILCVPYYREDFIHAILAKQITVAPLCTYLMDDQNIFSSRAPDHWVGDLLAVSDLSLGISSEMCAAYHRKYGRQIHLLPPVLEQPRLLVPSYWHAESGEPVLAAMIGNVWTDKRFTQLRELLRRSNLHIDWYGNGPKASWLSGTPEEWESDNIRCMGFFPEEDLVAALASYPFIVVPSGSLDAEDDNLAFSRLSLPSRLLFLHGSTDTPVLILGSQETAAGRFVSSLQTGLCSDYNAEVLQAQIGALLDTRKRQEFRSNIRRWSKRLVLENADQWIWQALASGQPHNAGFHEAFPAVKSANQAWLEQIAPPRSRPTHCQPKGSEIFQDAHGPSLGILRKSLHPVLAANGLVLPALDELELSQFQGAVAHYVLSGALPNGGDILFLGPDLPTHLQGLPSPYRIWQISDLLGWQKSGFCGDSSYIRGQDAGLTYPEAFPQFDAIISTGWCGQLGADPHVLEGLSLYLEACTRPGGVNAHFFSAALHATYFWTGPAQAYLRNRFSKHTEQPILDELLAADDVFTMSRTAYDRDWKPSTGKTYGDFGRPLSLGIYWRKSLIVQ